MSQKNDTPIMERAMKEVVKALLTLLVFFVVFALVLIPMLEEHFGISLFGMGGVNVEESLDMSDPAIENNYVDGVGYVVAITSNVKNTSDSDISNISVEYDLFDEHGNKVSKAVGNIDAIGAHAEMVLTASSISPIETRVHSCKIIRVISLKK